MNYLKNTEGCGCTFLKGKTNVHRNIKLNKNASVFIVEATIIIEALNHPYNNSLKTIVGRSDLVNILNAIEHCRH